MNIIDLVKEKVEVVLKHLERVYAHPKGGLIGVMLIIGAMYFGKFIVGPFFGLLIGHYY